MNMLTPQFLLGCILGLLIGTGILLRKSIFRIEEGYVGVLTSFGKAIMTSETSKTLRIWRPGLHLKWPWQVVKRVSIMEQSIELAGEEGGVMAMARDGTTLRLDSRLRFEPLLDELYNFLFALREPLPHVRGLFTCLLRNEIANFKGGSANSDEIGSYSVIRRERKLLNQRIEHFTRSKIGRNYGLRFDAVDLTDILPPDDLAQALNAVFSSQAEADARYARAQAEAQQRVMSSQHGVEIAKAKTQAVETEILVLGDFLEQLQVQNTLDTYIERRRSEVFSDSRAVYVRRPQ